jgi:hypothetical protein
MREIQSAATVPVAKRHALDARYLHHSVPDPALPSLSRGMIEPIKVNEGTDQGPCAFDLRWNACWPLQTKHPGDEDVSVEDDTHQCSEATFDFR